MGSMHEGLLRGAKGLLATMYKDVWEVPGVREEEQTTGEEEQTANGKDQKRDQDSGFSR